MPTVRIRKATPDDADVLVTLIRQLAAYENLLDEARPDASRLRSQLDEDAQPRCEALIAETVETESEPVGFALFFANYSTFLTRFGIYLEDLFVRPTFRGKGVGFRLLRRVARVAAARGCERVDWAVLDWNTPAIDFYRQIGAEPLDEWTTMRLTGNAIQRLAEEGGRGEGGEHGKG
ncbi:GNAT family N-acetyltransferase [Longibacter sp.]|jgi:diamine N-acetyltransferase|uniref:GNAT family N-acetyltransferase n=1 Tax=Longibacter sp. TaxID=2045415 RepID=UPI003EB922FE